MRNIKLSLWTLVLVLTILWLLADTLAPNPFNYFSLRAVLIQYTGVIGIGAMSVAMVLALRPRWLERPLHGLDKMYRLHKWLGITGLVMAVIHWWFAQGTKWMVGWGWLTRPARTRSPREPLGPLQDWLLGQRELAESIGEWAFYAAAILILLALIKRFPYHLFVKTHKLIALAYLVLAYHTFILAKFAYWTQPLGWLVAVLLLGGTFAAILVLAGRIGAGRKVQGVIESLIHYDELRVMEIAIKMEDAWPGHVSGQFAFVTSREEEGAHPYTIASAWDTSEGRIVFIVKALGDYTRTLREHLKVGTPVSVEGPYGCFTFEDRKARQIWVGAGIGITPFVARMKQLARTPGNCEIDLFHPTADFSPAAIEKLSTDAKAAKVRLHLLVDAKDGHLTGDRIRAAVPDWATASIWFCGPSGLGQMLKEDFSDKGLASRDFHQELFQMR